MIDATGLTNACHAPPVRYDYVFVCADVFMWGRVGLIVYILILCFSLDHEHLIILTFVLIPVPLDR